jgi:hypothetical protein
MTDDTESRGHRPRVPLGLPDTSDLAGVNAAEIAVVRLASDRIITSREAVELTQMLDHRRRALTDLDHDRRMAAIEKINRERAAADGEAS